MKYLTIILLPIFLFSCATLGGEKVVSTQLTEIKSNSTIGIGQVNLVDKNNLPVGNNQVRNFISIISAQTDYSLSSHDGTDYLLNIDIKESSYIKELRTETSIVANFSLINPDNNSVAYHGVLIKNSKKPIISDSLLFEILEKSYSLLVKTLDKNSKDDV